MIDVQFIDDRMTDLQVQRVLDVDDVFLRERLISQQVLPVLGLPVQLLHLHTNKHGTDSSALAQL